MYWFDIAECMKKIITIDGPAGSGKSTIAHILAKIYSFKHLNSGLLYRFFAYNFVQNYPNTFKEKVAAGIYFSKNDEDLMNNIEVRFDQEKMQLFFNGELLNQKLDFFPGIEILPQISKILDLRHAIQKLQHGLAEKFDLIADGRDCGSVVFPQAWIKFFLTASAKERANRVLMKLSTNNKSVKPIEEIILDIEKRDKQDLERKESPLIKAEDAILIDSSNLSVDATVKKMICLILEKEVVEDLKK